MTGKTVDKHQSYATNDGFGDTGRMWTLSRTLAVCIYAVYIYPEKVSNTELESLVQ